VVAGRGNHEVCWITTAKKHVFSVAEWLLFFDTR